MEKKTEHLARATFAGGCFWCMEQPFDQLPGVVSVTVGYIGGHKKNPTYEAVCSGGTGHAEAVQVLFDPAVISYESLLQVFWRNINPADPDGQFADRGSQYRPAIFCHDQDQRQMAERSKEQLQQSGRFQAPIVVGIEEATEFFPAEEHHQDYCRKNPIQYHSYRTGSGRDRFLDRFWAKERKK